MWTYDQRACKTYQTSTDEIPSTVKTSSPVNRKKYVKNNSFVKLIPTELEAF